MNFGEVQWAQRDGAPTILTTAVPRGERGVSLLRARFARAAWFKGTARQHLVFLQMLPCHRLNCRIGERRLVHEPSAGALAICPAGVDCSAESEADMDTVLLAVEPSQLTLIAAEADAPQDRLKERLSTVIFSLQTYRQMQASMNGRLEMEGIQHLKIHFIHILNGWENTRCNWWQRQKTYVLIQCIVT